MTTTIAVIGKSGSGKTTVAKSILKSLHSSYPEKSILIIDNDLGMDFGASFGINIESTIQDIRCGKCKYKSKIPDIMSKQEFIEWVLHDIIINLFDEVDLLTSGPIATKDCRCFVSEQIDDALVKLIKQYDIVIFDCEYDLEYLHQLVDYPIDATIIVADNTVPSVYSAAKIKETSQKLASLGQIGVVLNKINNRQIPENISAMLNQYELDILNILPCDEELGKDGLERNSEIIMQAIGELLYRLNLPQME